MSQSLPTKSERLEYRHILGPPASEETIRSWLQLHGSFPLPQDLIGLLRSFNGIHLWADVKAGRSYQGIAPIEEWERTGLKLFGPDLEAGRKDILEGKYVVISYHEDQAAFVVLNASAGTYYLMDAVGPDETCPLAQSTSELLDWLWRTRFVPGK